MQGSTGRKEAGYVHLCVIFPLMSFSKGYTCCCISRHSTKGFTCGGAAPSTSFLAYFGNKTRSPSRMWRPLQFLGFGTLDKPSLLGMQQFLGCC